jgi:hypothetical protein
VIGHVGNNPSPEPLACTNSFAATSSSPCVPQLKLYRFLGAADVTVSP